MTDTLIVLEQTPWLLYSLTLLCGLMIGSFLNVVILRLPRMMELEWQRDCAELHSVGEAPTAITLPESESNQGFNLASPPSRCPACGHRIRAWENIPVLSYLLLRGRCSACQARISLRYPLIELLSAVLSLMVIWQFGLTPQGGAALLFTWAMIALAAIDFDTQLLPDVITLPLLWFGLFLSLFVLFVDAETAIIGAISGYLSLWLVFQLFRLLTGREGMGRGDFKLLALFGAWMGWQALPQIILLSALPGALVGIALITLGRQQQRAPIPFGPFLAIAGWISLLWGNEITDAYLRYSGLI